MNFRLTILTLSVGLGLTGCGGDEVAEFEEVSRGDTTAVMPGMAGGMGAGAGMGGGMMMTDWERHMAGMQGARGDSLRAMMGPHRQMTGEMLETMDQQRMRMGMTMDSTWTSLRDSLRQDLGRMEGMTPELMAEFLEEHDARMRRMLRLHQDSTANVP